MNRNAIAVAAAATALILPASLGAAPPLSLRDNFRIGSGGSVFCSAQSLGNDRALVDMFDRGYSVVCRDAAVPVGRLYALRLGGTDPAARLAALRADQAICTGQARPAGGDLDDATVTECRFKAVDVSYHVYEVRKGKMLYVAEGLAGYDSALKLGLRSVVADELIPGEISIATTGAGDQAALARVQAGTLDAARALAEAYRRNNEGSYAESAEFFASVAKGQQASKSEGLANEGLQKSNLGRYAEADALFSRAEELVGGDPIVARQLRNYRAMHALNQGDPERALKELDKALPQVDAALTDPVKSLVIDAATAARLNSESPVARQLGNSTAGLQPKEKIEILDGQAQQLRGTALRLQGKSAAATAALAAADTSLQTVRGGKVSSVVWMRAQILSDLAAIAETTGNLTEADAKFRESIAVVEANYPGSAALLSAKAKLAAYLARHNQVAAAEMIFRDIVKEQAEAASSPPSLARVLTPYVDLLLKRGDPQSVAELFEATQVMLRPGVAQTQAVLARELSGGSDDAARLFRQAVTLTRQVERERVELSRLETIAQPTPEDMMRKNLLRASVAEAEKAQVATQAKLSEYPRFRAVSTATLSLADLQALLRPGEAYYKMTVVGDHVYALMATPKSARAVRIALTSKQLEAQVDALRETISVVEDGKRVTYPFDAELAHQLYASLFKPFEAELPSVRHLIFEPDGAMLRLPPNLLVMEEAGLAAYRERAKKGGEEEFDFTGIRWLGRERDISTSVSPRAFREVRSAPPASGSRQYLGLGQNLPATAAAVTAGGTRSAEDLDCVLSLSSWNSPISPEELRIAGSILGGGQPGRAEILTKEAFTDTAVMGRGDLREFRILHFATHGIVTSPKAKCPAQPALLTSFGGEGSDGLLTFREIFDLRLDADLVILSACDTASKASTAATRDAGLGTGGDVALDGLVRAFVGAGGRMVVASHWPVPDDFDATQRLITGLFTAPPGTGTASALRASQQKLMDDPATSHPFYWSGFAAIGDGAKPVVRGQAQPQVVASLR